MSDVIPPGHKYPLDALGQPHPADFGEVDMFAIRENLKLTPGERLSRNDQALKSMLTLQDAGENFYAQARAARSQLAGTDTPGP